MAIDPTTHPIEEGVLEALIIINKNDGLLISDGNPQKKGSIAPMLGYLEAQHLVTYEGEGKGLKIVMTDEGREIYGDILGFTRNRLD